MDKDGLELFSAAPHTPEIQRKSRHNATAVLCINKGKEIFKYPALKRITMDLIIHPLSDGFYSIIRHQVRHYARP